MDWSVCLSVIGCRTVVAWNLVDDVGVRCGGGAVLVIVSRSRRLVTLKSVMFMSWEAKIFLTGLVREWW